MKKVLLSFLGVLSITLFLTGCNSDNEEDTPIIQERVAVEKGVRVLHCDIENDDDGILLNMDVDITKDYDKNEFIGGVFTVSLTLNESATEEEVNMLKNISMCSNDMMGEFINYGDCHTTFEDKSLISTLVINKDLINRSTDMSLEKAKETIEKSQNSKNACTIQKKDE